MRVAVLTVSTMGARGKRKDESGDVAAKWVTDHGFTLGERAMIPDDQVEIVRTLLAWADSGECDLILTTGGTGLSPTDVTPEATRAVIEREAPGIAERLRVAFLESFPRAALSRGIAGSRGRTLIVNLPGSPSGVRDALAALDPIVVHACEILRGETGGHS